MMWDFLEVVKKWRGFWKLGYSKVKITLHSAIQWGYFAFIFFWGSKLISRYGQKSGQLKIKETVG